MRLTGCPGWSVHDLAAHILGGHTCQLSIGRDGYQRSWIVADEWDDLVMALNELNEEWVRAMGRMSPRLMIDLLKSTGYLANQYLESLDPHEVGPVVGWASPQPAPVWLHVAREYTEYWHHQQQIRGRGWPALADRSALVRAGSGNLCTRGATGILRRSGPGGYGGPGYDFRRFGRSLAGGAWRRWMVSV